MLMSAIVPFFSCVEFVKMASNDCGVGQESQEGVDADPLHQTLHSVGLGRSGFHPDVLVDLLHGDEPDEKEKDTETQVDAQRNNDKAHQVGGVVVADVADTGKRIPVHRSRPQGDRALDERKNPSEEMILGGVFGDGFCGPTATRCQIPAQGQNHPPTKNE